MNYDQLGRRIRRHLDRPTQVHISSGRPDVSSANSSASRSTDTPPPWTMTDGADWVGEFVGISIDRHHVDGGCEPKNPGVGEFVGISIDRHCRKVLAPFHPWKVGEFVGISIDRHTGSVGMIGPRPEVGEFVGISIDRH